MIILLFLALLVLVFVLIRSADSTIISLRRIGRQTKTGIFALSIIIAALGTSFPELFVGITSSLSGISNLSLGVVLGSNIANISLIGALSAFIVGRVHVSREFFKKDIFAAFIAGILPIILLLDGNLSRVDGLILVTIYFGYAASFFRGRYEQIARGHANESFFHRLFQKIIHIEVDIKKEYGKLFLSFVFVIISADLIVRIVQIFAGISGIGVFVIGLIVLALGTSLPELVFSLRSLEDHEPSMYVGNLLGSTIANSTFIVGISVLIAPIESLPVNQYLIGAGAFILIYLIFWAFIRSKFRLDRWEASVLIVLYLIFVIVELV